MVESRTLGRMRPHWALSIFAVAVLTVGILVAAPATTKAASKDLQVSVAPDGAPADGSSSYAKISADGHLVWFESTATNLVPGEPQSGRAVFIRNIAEDTTRRVDIAGTPASMLHAVSRNGRFAIVSLAVGNETKVFRYKSESGASDELPFNWPGLDRDNGGISDDGQTIFLDGGVSKSGQSVPLRCPDGSLVTYGGPVRGSLSASGDLLLFSSDRCGTKDRVRAYSMKLQSGSTSQIYNGSDCYWHGGNACVGLVAVSNNGLHQAFTVPGSLDSGVAGIVYVDGVSISMPQGDERPGICSVAEDGSEATLQLPSGPMKYSRSTGSLTAVTTEYTAYCSMNSVSADGALAYESDEGQIYITGQVATPTPTTPPPTLPPPQNFKYVALGDSYSSGEGIEPFWEPTNKCHRSIEAYAMFIEEPGKEGTAIFDRIRRGGVEWGFQACSGSETKNVLPTRLGGEPRPNDPLPQLELVRTKDKGNKNDLPVDAATDLVTITIGGNDVEFKSILQFCATRRDCTTTQFKGKSLKSYITSQLNALGPDLNKVYRQIHKQAPHARIIVAGYPQIFPELVQEQNCVKLRQHKITYRGASVYIGFSHKEQNFLRSQTSRLNQVIADHVDKTAATEFVPVDGLFQFHEVCGNMGEWINAFTASKTYPFVNDQSFHPNEKGQRLGYAAAINGYLNGFSVGDVASTGR
jgi:hypothetical protein